VAQGVAIRDEVNPVSDNRSRPGLYAMVMVLMVWLLLTMFQVGANKSRTAKWRHSGAMQMTYIPFIKCPSCGDEYGVTLDDAGLTRDKTCACPLDLAHEAAAIDARLNPPAPPDWSGIDTRIDMLDNEGRL
jgi:hypothetical protein